MKSAIAALAEENARLKDAVTAQAERERVLSRELRDMRHERDYYRRKLERETETSS